MALNLVEKFEYVASPVLNSSCWGHQHLRVPIPNPLKPPETLAVKVLHATMAMARIKFIFVQQPQGEIDCDAYCVALRDNLSDITLMHNLQSEKHINSKFLSSLGLYYTDGFVLNNRQLETRKEFHWYVVFKPIVWCFLALFCVAEHIRLPKPCLVMIVIANAALAFFFGSFTLQHAVQKFTPPFLSVVEAKKHLESGQVTLVTRERNSDFWHRFLPNDPIDAGFESKMVRKIGFTPKQMLEFISKNSEYMTVDHSTQYALRKIRENQVPNVTVIEDQNSVAKGFLSLISENLESCVVERLNKAVTELNEVGYYERSMRQYLLCTEKYFFTNDKIAVAKPISFSILGFSYVFGMLLAAAPLGGLIGVGEMLTKITENKKTRCSIAK